MPLTPQPTSIDEARCLIQSLLDARGTGEFSPEQWRRYSLLCAAEREFLVGAMT